MSQVRRTLKQDRKLLIIMRKDQALTVNSDGVFELYMINDQFPGTVAVIDGVGYEFIRSISSAGVYSLLKELKGD